MSDLESSLIALVRFLETSHIPYMVIGGFAVLVWAEPRFTRDVDVTIWVTPERVEETVRVISESFTARVSDPISFVRSVRVLPIIVGAISADIIFGNLPYEEAAIARAKPVLIQGIAVSICTPEDLVLHKIVSPRAKDREDIESIFKVRHAELDYTYLDVRVEELSVALSDSTLLDWYRALRARWPPSM